MPDPNPDTSTLPADNQKADKSGRESLGRWLVRPQTMIALSAVVLSVCGLFVSLYEASLIRRHHRASVWPHVAATVSLRSNAVRFFVQNTGVGPARIRAATVTVDGETKEDWEDVIRSILDDPGRVGAYQSLINGQVLPPSSPEETIFEVTRDTADAASEVVPAFRQSVLDGRLDVEVCYCSVYDECWTSSMQNVVFRARGIDAPLSEPIESCQGLAVSGI